MLGPQALERELEPSPWRRRAYGAYSSIRSGLASLSKVGLAPKPKAPQGISALVRVKNEPYTIEACLRSVADFVDEFVVVDASTDATTQIVGDTARTYGLPLVHVFSQPASGSGMSTGAEHAADSQRGLETCNRRWVLRWDADLVARPLGPYGFGTFRQRLLALDEGKHYVVHVPMVRLAGDTRHVGTPRLQREGYAFTQAPGLKYVDAGRYEMLKVPWYFARLRWPEPVGFHLADYKPNRRIFQRKYWTDWRELQDHKTWPTLDAYALHRARETWPDIDEDEAVRRSVQEFVAGLRPYPELDFGPRPAGLLALERVGAFRVVEDASGRPVDRLESLPRLAGTGVGAN